MTRIEAQRTYDAYVALQTAHAKAVWSGQPSEPMSTATINWYSASHLLLDFCHQLLTDGIEEGVPPVVSEEEMPA